MKPKANKELEAIAKNFAGSDSGKYRIHIDLSSDGRIMSFYKIGSTKPAIAYMLHDPLIIQDIFKYFSDHITNDNRSVMIGRRCACEDLGIEKSGTMFCMNSESCSYTPPGKGS